MIPILN
jgi:chromosome segregation ATPase